MFLEQAAIWHNTRQLSNDRGILVIAVGEPDFNDTEILFRRNGNAINILA